MPLHQLPPTPSTPSLAPQRSTRRPHPSLGLLLATLLLALPSPAWAQSFDAVDELLADHVDDRRIAGATARIVFDNQVVYDKTFGHRDLEARAPMRSDTIIRIASMTKPITSVAVMILHEQGHFDLDDHISDFLPEFENPRVLHRSPRGDWTDVPAQREITIRHLLNHTSGITYGFSGPWPLADLYRQAGITDGFEKTNLTLQENVRRIARQPLMHHPGQDWGYGLSAEVLGRLVEVVSGQRLDTFYRQHIFEPLGMNDTHFYLPEHKVDRLAAMYRPGPGRRVERVTDDTVRHDNFIYSPDVHHEGPQTYHSPGVGLVSTLDDYGRFLQMLLNEGQLDGHRLLEPETVRQMHSDQLGHLDGGYPSHGDSFGFGFGVVTEAGADAVPMAPGCFGWGGIFHTVFWVAPDQQFYAILMTQVYPFGHPALRQQFRSTVFESLPPEAR